ncbi:hypothetical protein CPB97_010240 [Podila verticillata]|nr:hypothetical protein CPB97_010240 [Podila verticillata]
MDKKTPIPPPALCSPSDEQELFGNQAPFASVGTSHPPTVPGPSHPQQHFNSDHIPQDAPPMYTEQPHVYPEQPVAQPASPSGYAPLLSPQPQPYYSGQPSYGAIPPNPQYTPNHQGYRPIRQQGNDDSSSEDEHDRQAHRKHRRKKRKSKCRKCCCWTIILILLFTWFPSIAIFSNDTCSIDKAHGKIFESLSVKPSSSLDTRLEIDENILGEVVVMQSPDWMQSDVQTRLRLQGSSKRVVDAVDIGIDNNKTTHTASISVYLKAGSPSESRQILKGECLKAYVEIIYPRSVPGTGSLDITTTAGTITVKLDKPEATFRSIALSSTLGDITLDGVHVQKRTSVRAVKGNVSGMIKTTGEVDIEVEKGTINLSVDDAPNIHGWDRSTLDVKLSTVHGTVDLKQVRRFQGHFLLTTRVGNLEFRPSSRYEDLVHRTSNSGRQIAGWISKNGKEPVSLLPRIELKTVAGNLKATIQDPPSKE